MDEQALSGLRDYIKVRVFDGEGNHIGHVQDVAVSEDLSDPVVTHLGVHFFWCDRVGRIELVRSVEDVVLLIPWSLVVRFDDERIELSGVHPERQAETAEGKVLLRTDVLDKQMLDPDGNRIQRVDDVVLRSAGGKLEAVGLEVSMGVLGGSSIRDYVMRLRKKHAGDRRTDVIPWKAIKNLEADAVVIEEVLHPPERQDDKG